MYLKDHTILGSRMGPLSIEPPWPLNPCSPGSRRAQGPEPEIVPAGYVRTAESLGSSWFKGSRVLRFTVQGIGFKGLRFRP